MTGPEIIQSIKQLWVAFFVAGYYSPQPNVSALLVFIGTCLLVLDQMPRLLKLKIWKPAKKTRFIMIADKYRNIEELGEALRKAGLEASNLILGIDFTASNTSSGRMTFGDNLHAISSRRKNPYQEVIEIIGKTLSPFDDDNEIDAFGFGDSTTKNTSVFSFNDGVPCQGFDDVLEKYSSIAQTVTLSGPTCFGPIIRQAIKIVKRRKSYHILVIIADGQMSNEKKTADAIVEASNYPLSIIVVGVGDGPWDTMEDYDDQLPERQFDNFQFVDFSKTVRGKTGLERETAFAVAAMQEIPSQYRAIQSLSLLRPQ